MKVAGDDGHDDVAVEGDPGLVDGYEPVGVAVENQPDLAVQLGGQELGMGGATAVVDIETIRLAASVRTLSPNSLKRRGAARKAAPLAPSMTTSMPRNVYARSLLSQLR